MTSSELIKNIIDYCNANYNEANVKKYSYFFKGEYNAYGLSAPQIHSKVKELLKADGVSYPIVMEAAPILIKSAKYEEVSIALLLVNEFGKQFTNSLFKEIEKWFEVNIHNWAHADTLGMLVLPQFLKYNIINYTDFSGWLTSKYKFQRRCVPVTLIKYLKMKKTTDFAPVFKFIEPLMTDPEREVHQGVGWFLREAWKLKNAETKIFLMKWKDTAPRLIIQYATEKMTKEEKLKYKKSK